MVHFSIGGGRHITGTILEGEEFPCGFCKRTGVTAKTHWRCPVCRGKGTVKVTPVAVTCAYCKGRGEVPVRSGLTCPACKGRGAVGGGNLPCTACQGKGVVTAHR